jgi:curved DNA-binding protein CbpA
MSKHPEDIDIDVETQKRIVDLVARLDVDDHYKLLGVSPDADKAEIRRAYFELMNLYHADRFFGKKTGKFAPFLLKITDVLTRASETLSRNKTRAEYDAYLASRRGTLGARSSIVPTVSDSTRPSGATGLLDSTPASGPPLATSAEAVGNIPPAPRAPHLDMEEVEEISSPIIDPPREPLTTASPGPSSTPPAPSARGPASNDAARKLLARKMGLRIKSPMPQNEAGALRETVRADLKARFDAKRNEGDDSVRKLLLKSATAQKAGDWSGAVAAIRMALELRPEDGALQRELNSVQEEADRALAPRFLEQAKYEEKQSQWARAARSYERAARGKDSAALFNKAADCLLHLEILNPAEKRMVVELARNAVTRDLQRVVYRLTLAQAYSVAGMKTSAQGEVARALELEPENQQAKLLQKSLK